MKIWVKANVVTNFRNKGRKRNAYSRLTGQTVDTRTLVDLLVAAYRGMKVNDEFRNKLKLKYNASVAEAVCDRLVRDPSITASTRIARRVVKRPRGFVQG